MYQKIIDFIKKTPYNPVLLGIIVSIAYWVLDSYFRAILNPETRLYMEMFHPTSPDRVVMLVIVATSLVIFGHSIRVVVGKRDMAEMELVKRMKYLESIMESSMDVILTVKSDGTFGYANKALENLTGYKLEEIKGKSFLEFIPPELHPMMMERWQEVTRDKPGIYETRIIKSDGSIIDCRVSHSKMQGVDEYIAIIRDITERKKAGDAIRESEERYRLIFNRSPAGIYLYDRNLIIRHFNDRFVTVFRSTRERLTNFDMTKVRDGRLLPATREVLEDREGFYDGEYSATTSDARIWVTLRTAPVHDELNKKIPPIPYNL